MAVIYEPMGAESVLTVPEFAAKFRLSESAVARIAAGRIPGAKVGGVYRAYVAATRSFDESDAASLPEAG